MTAVATGSPFTREVTPRTKSVSIAVQASGGVINVSYKLSEEVGAIVIPWSVGEVADGSIGSAVIDANITSFTVTGDGKVDYRFRS